MRQGKGWTTTELRIIAHRRGAGIYGKAGWRSACAAILGRSKASISYGARLIGRPEGRPGNDYKPWTDEEKRELLLMASKGITWRSIGIILDRTRWSCRTMAYKLLKEGNGNGK